MIDLRVLLMRWGLRTVYALPRPVRRLLAGPSVRVGEQELDLDLQLLGRLSTLIESDDGGVLDRAALAEQRRQADLAAEAAAESGLDDVVVRDLMVPGGAHPRPARLYVPPSAGPEPAGLLLFFHGGGFALGSLATADPMCRLLAAQSGVRVLSVGYRLAPEHPYPAALEDALAAFRHVRATARSLGARPELVAVGGDSAGGNLALVVAHQEPVHGPAFVLALYPVTDVGRTGGSREEFGTGFGLTSAFIRELEGMYLPDGMPADDGRGAILRADDFSAMPPVYLATAGFDPLRDEGEELVERLRADGVPVVARRFPGLVHGYASFTAVSAAARDATLDAASALHAGLALVEGRPSAGRQAFGRAAARPAGAVDRAS